MADINDAYYKQIAHRLQTCAVAEFTDVIAEHKANILAGKFREPPEKIFAENLPWVAQQVITQANNSPYYKTPADITDADIQKLELLRTGFDFDYMKDLRITFTAMPDGKRLEYTQPFLVYLASKPDDFTDLQTDIIRQLVERLDAKGESWGLEIGYSTRSGRGNNHNNEKNIFHVLLENELTPNKKTIADIVAPKLAEKPYRIYAMTSSWEGSRGQNISQDYDTYRNALHSAVASGRLENVEYAMSKGAKQSKLYNSVGSTAFADAAARVNEPAYRAIAQKLFENALTLEKGVEILREPSRWGKKSTRPIETLGRMGDLPFVLAMAQANAGAPEMAAQAFTYTSPVTLGGYHSMAAGNDAVYHAPIQINRTKIEWQVTETGRMEDPFPFIRQAVFNLDPKTGSYSAYQDIFGMALTYLVEQGALKAADIPKDSLSDPRSLNFIFALRAAAETEKARNPDFLSKTAVFTESFAAEVDKARGCTNNFRVLYDAANPEKNRAAAYDVKTTQPIAIKAPRAFKKPDKGAAPQG
ncbi:MAG: hypothetical protein PW788_14585 [Micavibrio sp.]|nr:hypothetical protein [Micavibrio sp.]